MAIKNFLMPVGSIMNENERKQRLRIVQVKDFVKEEDNIQWLIEGLLPNTGWTILVGARGIGKTTFIVQMIDAIQEGKPFLGLSTTQSSVLYLQADSSPSEWRQMLRNIVPSSESMTMVSVPSGCLDRPTDIEKIHRIQDMMIKSGYNLDLVIFDSLYNFTRQSINSEQVLYTIDEMRKIATIDEETKPFIVIHHPNKSEMVASGHNSLEGNPSNVWYLMKSKLKIEKGRLHGNKEILITRNEKGLWISKEEVSIEGLDDLGNLSLPDDFPSLKRNR